MSNSILRLSDYFAQNNNVYYDHYLNKLTEQIATNIEPKPTVDGNARAINDNTPPVSVLSSTLWPNAPPFIPYSYTTEQPMISTPIGSNAHQSKANVWFTKFWNNYPIADQWCNNNSADLMPNAYQMPNAVQYNNWYEPNGRPIPEPIGSGRTVGQTASPPQPTYSYLPPTEPSEWNYDSSYIQPKIRRRSPSQMECVFCKNNDEPPELYKSHILKDPECRIVCPVLRAYDCPICHNGGGDKAHTVRYCPLNRAGIHVKLERIRSEQLDQLVVPENGYVKRTKAGKPREKYYNKGFR